MQIWRHSDCAEANTVLHFYLVIFEILFSEFVHWVTVYLTMQGFCIWPRHCFAKNIWKCWEISKSEYQFCLDTGASMLTWI